MRRFLLSFAWLFAGMLLPSRGTAELPGPVPQPIRDQFQLAPFYQKYLDAGGLPIVGSAKVSDDALAECDWIARRMLEHRPEILTTLGKAKVRFAVMAHNEYTTDIPEHATLEPRVYWDRRARGLGASVARPAVSCAEENLLAFPGDPYSTENIAIHEFAHAIHLMGLKDSTFDEDLKRVYTEAIKAGLWKGTYAAENREEYWAEAVQSWFDNNRENDALHNHVNTRAELKAYDPRLATLVESVFGDRTWRYVKPADRSAKDRAHLAAWNPATAPQFQWREAPVPERPRVMLQCAEGEIELEFDAKVQKAELAAFLSAVHLGRFSNGLAEWSKDGIRLAPAAGVTRGEPATANAGEVFIAVSTAKPSPDRADVLRATINKGVSVIHKLSLGQTKSAQARPVPIQRIVRLN